MLCKALLQAVRFNSTIELLRRIYQNLLYIKKQRNFIVSLKLLTRTQFIVIIPLSLAVNACILLWIISDSLAETGVGKDVFKVIVSIYGIKDRTGDVTAIVTADGHSRVKTFYLNRENLTTNNSSNQNVLRFTAAFPNVVLKSGDTYN